MGSDIGPVIAVVGLLAAVGVFVVKRCDWFQICDNSGGGGDNSVTDSTINPKTGTNINVKKTEKFLKQIHQDSKSLKPQIEKQLANSPLAKQANLPVSQQQSGCKIVNGSLMAVNSSGVVIGSCQSGLGSAYATARFSRIAI